MKILFNLLLSLLGIEGNLSLTNFALEILLKMTETNCWELENLELKRNKKKLSCNCLPFYFLIILWPNQCKLAHIQIWVSHTWTLNNEHPLWEGLWGLGWVPIRIRQIGDLTAKHYVLCTVITKPKPLYSRHSYSIPKRKYVCGLRICQPCLVSKTIIFKILWQICEANVFIELVQDV